MRRWEKKPYVKWFRMWHTVVRLLSFSLCPILNFPLTSSLYWLTSVSTFLQHLQFMLFDKWAAIQNKKRTPHMPYDHNYSCYILTIFFPESALCNSSSSQQNMLRMRANTKRPSWLADSKRNGTMSESTTLYRHDSTHCELSRGRKRDSPGREQSVLSSSEYSHCHHLDSHYCHQ
jgi:hypothetical protein